MKGKTLVYLFMFCYFFLTGHSVSAIDISGHQESIFTIEEGKLFAGTNVAALDFEFISDFFAVVSLRGIHAFGNSMDTALDLPYSYVEIYPAWGLLGIGRQPIHWGEGYIFNIVDIFNPIHFQPDQEKEVGIEAAVCRWYGPNLQIETVFAPESAMTDSRYGLRVRTMLNKFDYTVNFLRNTSIFGQELIYALETKGQVGKAAVGIWGQLGYSVFEKKDDCLSVVIGSDYTLPIGNGLYVLGELLYSSDQEYAFFKTSYTHSNYLTWGLDLFHNLLEKSGIYQGSLSYLFMDDIEFSIKTIHYPNGKGKGWGLGVDGEIKQELVFVVSTYFK